MTRSAQELAAAVRAKEVSPTELMAASLEAIAARNEAVNAIIWLDEDDARAQAAAATERISREGTDDLPPFFGVPIPVKDLYDVAGTPNTNGSDGASGENSAETGIALGRLAEAGFLLTGRSNSPEFGTITSTENSRFGISRNPWNPDHTPGGSSGGAGAAVAADLFAIAHGSDGGGSIRIPASCNGLVGLKAARGRIPGSTVSWEGASTEGVLTRTVADTAAVLDAIGRPDPLAWWTAPPPERPFLDEVGADPGRLRICVATEAPMGLAIDPACQDAVDQTARILADAGHEVFEGGFDSHIDGFVAHFGSVVDAGLAGTPVDWDKVLPYNRQGYDRARAIDSLTYVEGVQGLQRWTRDVNAQWGRDFDLLLTPTMAVQPPRAGQVLQEITASPADTSMTVLQTVLFTSLFNMNGLPAISLPVHVAADTGLPIGAQLVGGPWGESVLLRVAAQVEAAVDWRSRQPDLAALTN